MRRLTLAALSAALFLSACSDTSRETPTEPGVAKVVGPCNVAPFPQQTVVHQIKRVFPSGLRGEATSRSSAIKDAWDGCQPALARQGVSEFVTWMNTRFVAGDLVGTAQQRTELINTLFTGVGLTAPPVTLGSDFGMGTLDPNATTTTRIETENNTGAIEFEPAAEGRPAAFDELTVVSIQRRPDAFRLEGFPEEDQFPPFFDYTATNASNEHRITEGAIARMGFCLLGLTSFPEGYPDGVRIGHNPDPSLPPPRFEIIAENEDAGDFDLDCGNLQTSLGPFRGGLLGVGYAAGRFLAPLARALFVPQRLMAVTVGTRGPLSGLPTNLSPFGVVNATSYFGYEDGEAAWNDNESFWNRRTSAALSNSAFPTYVSTFNAPGVPGGSLPAPFRKNHSGWYGQTSTGNYIGTQSTGDVAGSGGTGTGPNSGAFVSPELQVPNVSADVQLRFNTWWEIEGTNPGRARVNPTAGDPTGPFDVMDVYLEADGEEGSVFLIQLNPDLDPVGSDRAAKPYTSGGFNTAPAWVPMAVDISEFKGQTVRIRFEFTTRDHQYNGFRGWMVEDVRVSTGTSNLPVIELQSLRRLRGTVVPGRNLPPVSRD